MSPAEYSHLIESFKGFEESLDSRREVFDILSFNDKEKKQEAQKRRISKALKDFWYFDQVYFPEKLYKDGYFKPNIMLKKMVDVCQTPGYHLFLGPRKHGKTVNAKKLFVWLLIKGIIKTTGTYSSTLPRSADIMGDIANIIEKNSRIAYDFKPVFLENNKDKVVFSVKNTASGLRTIVAFSEGRSVRSYSETFNRPDFLLGDDIETLESSFSQPAVQLRINKVVEAYTSLGDKGIFMILGNNISQACAMNQLRLLFEKKLLPDNFFVYRYKAFDKKPLWFEKYPAKTEAEFKAMIKPLNEYDYSANYQSDPSLPEGKFFTKSNYIEYNEIPKDAIGIIYCDPNLSKKGKGNTTAILSYLYSATLDLYFIYRAVCKSFSDPNELLQSILDMKDKLIIGIGFDGNVTQESHWTQHVRNYCRINNIPFPRIEYMRYNVNYIAKNAQLIYNSGKVRFPAGFSLTEDGQMFLQQFFSFTGQKVEGAEDDDAADAFICANEYIHSRKITKRNPQPTVSFKDYYNI